MGVLLGLAVGAVSLGRHRWLQRELAAVGPGEGRIVHIPSGTGTSEIAALLKRGGLIRDELAFQVGLRQWGLAGKLKAGYYRLSPAMSAREIAWTIAEGREATAKVTIPEGYTVAQIAARLEGEQLCSAKDFLAACRPATVASLGLPIEGDSLEGYLFPDTYLVKYGAAPEAVARQMVDTFRRRVVEGLSADLGKSKRSLHQVVTIASMIEREAEVGKDRPLIASVIENRLREGMRLQVDATVIYALGEHRKRLTYRDLRVRSPFNTYRHAGLPPHAICNPGLSSIRAALRPAKTEYLFYVARPSGSHIFTKTYEEHLKAIERVRGR